MDFLYLRAFLFTAIFTSLTLAEYNISEVLDVSGSGLYRLIDDIESKALYDKELIPVCNDAPLPVNVTLDNGLYHILNVDDKEQKMTVQVWMRWFWKDCRLRWNPGDYGGTKEIMLSSERVWIPDITLYDGVSVFELLEILEYQRIVVGYDGTVQFYFPSVFSLTCRLHLLYFPFDRQLCQISFVSWVYHANYIDVRYASEIADANYYVPSTEWRLKNYTATKVIETRGRNNHVFPRVIYTVDIERYSKYYQLNLILPSFMINVLGLLSFYLPPDSGERMALSITVLMTMMLFQFTVADHLPSTSRISPMLQEYCAQTIIIISVACITTVVIIAIHHNGQQGKPVPQWMHLIFLQWLSHVLLVKPCKLHRKSEMNDHSESEMNNHEPSLMTLPIATQDYLSEEDMEQVQKILSLMKLMKEEIEMKEGQEMCRNHWIRVARVLDRLSMLIFTVAVVYATLPLYVDYSDLQY